MRHTRSLEARNELREAVRLAIEVGDDEWETWAAASVMLGYVEAVLGHRDAAHAVFDGLIERCQSRGDLLHLATAYNNRTQLAITEGNGDAALADQREHVRLARELGMWTIEQYGTYNLAVLCYQLGDLDGAQAHANEVFAIENRHRQSSAVGVATRLLEGRILAARGELVAARRVVDAIPRDAVSLPFMETQWQTLELLTRDADDTEWASLVSQAATATPEELIDLHDLRAQVLFRRGQCADAHVEWQRALALVDRSPNLSRTRLVRATRRAPTVGSA